MNQPQPTQTIRDGHVVTLGYTLWVDGKVIDTSVGEGNRPVQFIQGKAQIVRGLENALYGMAVGDTKEVVVLAADGYGEYNPAAFAELPRTTFDAKIPLRPGVSLKLRDNDGNIHEATVVSADKNTVRLNFNHPLAGKDLRFSVKVLAIRQATPEELEHRHVHDS